MPALLRRDRHPVRGLEPGPGLRVGLDVLEPGQLVGDGPHVAAALHVVLAAQRDQPGPVPAHMPGEQGQVDEGEDVVGGVVVLGDAEGPADLRPIGAGVVVRQPADEVGGHAGVALGTLQRVVLHRRRVGVEAGGGPFHERLVHQPGLDDLAADGVRQRDVRPDVDAEPRVGPLRRRGPPRVHRVHAGAVPEALQHVVEEDRVRFARVGAPHDNQVGVFRLPVRTGAATSPEHCRQTDDARSVSSSVAAVDVVAAHHGPGELLGHVVHLVRGLRAAEHAERL